MAATNFTPISLYYSTTASAVPTAANLVQGELAINTNDGKLYYEDSSGVVQVLATKSTGSIGGSNTQVQFNNSGSLGGSSGLTWDGSFLTTSSIKNSALTSGRVTYAGASGLLSDSANLTFSGSNLGVNGTTTIGNQLSSGTSGSFSITGVGGAVYLQTGQNTSSGSSAPLVFTNSGALNEWMRITSAGNVGIGTSSPAFKTEIVGGATTVETTLFQIRSDAGGIGTGSTIAFANSTSTTAGSGRVELAAIRTTSSGGSFVIRTGDDSGTIQERMRITSAGNVGIGTSSPSYTLDVTGQIRASSGASASALIATSTSSGGTALNIQNNGTVNALIGGWLSCIGSGNATDVAIAAYQGALGFATNGANIRMTLDSSGNLGIGATSAGNKLQISNGGANGVEFDVALASGTESKMLSINRTSSAYTPLNYDASLHKFFISGGQKMQLDASGNLLVGTTSNTTNGGFIFSPDYNGTGISNIIVGHKSTGGNGNQYMIFNYNGIGLGSIAQDSTTGVLYNTTSDQRLKTNIVDASSGNIDNIKVRSFDWIADGSHQEYGMVAQELIEVAPYAVHQPKNPDEMMGVDYSKLVPMMIKEIQDLKQRIATLENK